MTSTELNGGIQFVPQIAVQYIYLDFDGELTSYNGEFLTVDHVEVQHSQLTEERISAIVSALNEQYISQNVIFVTERPVGVEYSSIYIGKTSAFDEYGNFAGLAETIDKDNKISTDNAFVMLDETTQDAKIISTVSHEADHILGNLEHEGSGLNAFAEDGENEKQYYNYYYYNQTLTGDRTGSFLVLQHNSADFEKEMNSLGYDQDFYYYQFAEDVNLYSQILVDSGGIANNTNVESKGWLVVLSSGVANNTVVNDGGTVWIHSGGTATEITENGGCVWIESGTNVTFASNTIDGFVVSSYNSLSHPCYMTVHSNTIANNITVSSGGSMRIYTGGIANNITVDSGGSMNIYSGGTATDIKTNGGYFYVEAGAKVTFLPHVFENLTISNSISIYENLVMNACNTADGYDVDINIYSGGVANEVTINDMGQMYIESNGVANGTIVRSGGQMYIESDGVANGTTVSAGGRVTVWEDGIMSNTRVLNDGEMEIRGGVVHRGTLEIEDGAIVDCHPHSIIDFTVSERTIDDDFLINNFSVLCMGQSPTFTITVSANQESGMYRLAQQVEDYWWDPVTIGDGKLTYGTIMPEEVLEYKNTEYHLIKDNGDLLLLINSDPRVFVYNDGILTFSGAEVADIELAYGDNDYMEIFEEGIAYNTVVCDGAKICVNYGGIADGITVKSGGYAEFLEGSWGYNLDIVRGGMAYIDGFVTVSYNPWFSDNIALGANAHIEYLAPDCGFYLGSEETGLVTRGTDVSNQTVKAGMSAIIFGGEVNNTTVAGGGEMYVLDENSPLLPANNVVFTGKTVLKDRLYTAKSVTVNGSITFAPGENLSPEIGLTNSYKNISSCKEFVIDLGKTNNEIQSYRLIDDASGIPQSISITGSNGKKYSLETFSTDGVLVLHKDYSLNFFKYSLPTTYSELETFLVKSEMWNWQNNISFKIPLTLTVKNLKAKKEKENEKKGLKWLKFEIEQVGFAYSQTLKDEYEYRFTGKISMTVGFLTVSADAGSENYGLYLRYKKDEKQDTLTLSDWDIAGKLSVSFDVSDSRFKFFGKFYSVSGTVEIDTRDESEKLSVTGDFSFKKVNDKKDVEEGVGITVSAEFSNIFRDDADFQKDKDLWKGLSKLSFSASNINLTIGYFTLCDVELAWGTGYEDNGVRGSGSGSGGGGGGGDAGKTVNTYSGSIRMKIGEFKFSATLSERFLDVFTISADLISASISLADISVKGKFNSYGDFAAEGNITLLAYEINGKHGSLIGTSAQMQIACATNGTETEEDDVFFVSGEIKLGSIITAQGAVIITKNMTEIAVKGSVEVPEILQWIGAPSLVEGGAIYKYQGGKTHSITLWGKWGDEWLGGLYVLNTGMSESLSNSKRLQNSVTQTYETVEKNKKAVSDYLNGKDQKLRLVATYQADATSDLTVGISKKDGTAEYLFNLQDYQQQPQTRSLPGEQANIIDIGDDVQIQVVHFSEYGFSAYLTGKTAGEWELYAVSSNSTLQNVSFQAETEEKKLQEFSLDGASLQQDGIRFDYTCKVAEGVTNCKISLYCDSDTEGNDGRLVATWDSLDHGVMTFLENQWLNFGGSEYFYLSFEADSFPLYSNYYTVDIPALTPYGDENGQRWNLNEVETLYTVEYSRDNYKSAFAIQTITYAVDTYTLADGTFQWRLKAEDEEFINGNDIAASEKVAPQKFLSDADGNTDIFFAGTYGVWEKDYAAKHQGILKGWTGTNEKITLEGKNKIADVFTGSTDANVLVLTDDANGDALFVEDVYTRFGCDAARLAQIEEIRAGFGDDIVDLTSQKFAYEGKDLLIYGGSGDDVIWANSGNNTLFGDAGNDRLIGGSGDDIITGGAGDDNMHGGGGDDTFCFGANFGNDTVEQLSSGKVTLHFETGSEDNWNQETLTYTDGANSVKVSGVTEVTLVFGGAAPVDGAFLEAASENIFEKKANGMIA